ncbi:SNF2-related protein [Nakamurella multipartita]|uniref:Helicase domain protein n=1 Tax=Nakamurella multipartita (strain ATCC 700099 / DSM 44233 / CIP 104796 / JCM 9543 / NBRC 105858 / Y-104) TaxID=479431 RepID=C8X8L5_NAKMY|nr:DEAD/DEAH box helicase [Nakamurella multipartita]ACV79070.1 helicase domain protein [Nakamurella multipartita DSM 44233]
MLAFGGDPAAILAAAGFRVEPDAAELVGGPLLDADPGDPSLAVIRPSLTGLAGCLDLIGGMSAYAAAAATVDSGVVRVPWERARSLTFRRSRAAHEILDPPTRWSLPALSPELAAAARRLAASTGPDGSPQVAVDVAVVSERFGAVPDWFAVELDPHQVTGALAAVAGHTAIVDPPGVGKTLTVLAALAISGSARTVIVTPPQPVIGHWQREVTRCGLADHAGRNARLVALDSGARTPVLPDAGVVLVPDTLLAARPELVDLIAGWRPVGFAVDEVHRCKTWTSLRSRAVRRLARQCSGIRLAASGTPMLANVVEMAPMLAITGHLDAVFGGRAAFQANYARENRFGGWVNRRRELPKLRALLDQQVWVRRPKIMPTTKTRRVLFIDPDPRIVADAYDDVHRTVDEFLLRHRHRTGTWPDRGSCLKWACSQLGLVTQLRRAAGMAKAAAIAGRAAAWMAGRTRPAPDTAAICDRPLIIWTWHRQVAAAIAAAVSSRPGRPRQVGVITGATPGAERVRLCDEYQAGRLPLLVCSIPTVGVGVTLTRGCDAWMAETSWTPAEISQAEDRQWRRGQSRNVVVTTFIGLGTLDERVQDSLGRKADDLDQVLTGGDNQVAVLHRSTRAQQADLLYTVVADRIGHLNRNHRRTA